MSDKSEISTGTQDSLPVSISKMKDKFAESAVQETLEGFTKTMQFSFIDLKDDYVFTINNGRLANVEKKSLPDASIVITIAEKLMEDILNKASNPITAYMTGRMKVRGSMECLIRLQKIIS